MEKLLNTEQEDALFAVAHVHGYNKAYSDALRILENELGKVHTVTIQVRKSLGKTSMILADRCNKLVDESKLSELYSSRME